MRRTPDFVNCAFLTPRGLRDTDRDRAKLEQRFLYCGLRPSGFDFEKNAKKIRLLVYELRLRKVSVVHPQLNSQLYIHISLLVLECISPLTLPNSFPESGVSPRHGDYPPLRFAFLSSLFAHRIQIGGLGKFDSERRVLCSQHHEVGTCSAGELVSDPVGLQPIAKAPIAAGRLADLRVVCVLGGDRSWYCWERHDILER